MYCVLQSLLMSDQLSYLCSNFRTDVDPRSLVFATTAETRNEQSYLASTNFEEDKLIALETVSEMVNTYGKEPLLRELNTRRDAFVRFLKALNAAISSSFPQNYTSCVMESRGSEEQIIFHIYCLIACILFYTEKSFAKIGPFVANLATRIYRIPESARILRGIRVAERFKDFVPNPAAESNSYALLLSCFESSLTVA